MPERVCHERACAMGGCVIRGCVMKGGVMRACVMRACMTWLNAFFGKQTHPRIPVHSNDPGHTIRGVFFLIIRYLREKGVLIGWVERVG